MRFLAALWFLLVSNCCFGQELRGRVFSSENQPVAFATVAHVETGIGTITDIDGKFVLNLPTTATGSLSVRHVSYLTKVLNLSEFEPNSIVYLEPDTRALEELVFEAGENPADKIMRQVIKHRKKHDPSNLESYRYRSYTKEVMRLQSQSKQSDEILNLIRAKPPGTLTSRDSAILRLEQEVHNNHLFVSESLADIQFVSPGLQSETVIATNISGFKHGVMASTGSAYQPFGFYGRDVKLLDKEFINPINARGLSQYDFYIEDTTTYYQDTVFVISFSAKKPRTFEALEGLLYIHAQDYALTNVLAESIDPTSKIHIQIQQLYDKILGNWFPVQLNTNLLFKDYGLVGRSMIVENKRYLSDIDINSGMKPSQVGDVTYRIMDEKHEVSKELFDRMGISRLDSLEQNTFARLDSADFNFEKWEKIIRAIVGQRVAIGPLDLRLDQIYGFNQLERHRLGIGLETNSKLSSVFTFSGYSAYGFGDEELKYGGGVKVNFLERSSLHMKFNFSRDINEAGTFNFFEYSVPKLDDFVRSWEGSLFDWQERYQLSLGSRIAPFIYAQCSWKISRDRPLYEYQYQNNGELLSEYQISEMSASLRYVKNERYLDFFGRKFLRGHDYPSFNIRYAQGVGMVGFTSDFEYQRLDAVLEYDWSNRLGKTNVYMVGGYIDGDLPFGQLLTGWGNSTGDLTVPHYFQTMGLYEFVSDRASAIFLTHNFGNIWINTRFTKPELLIYQSSGFGSLSFPERHTEINFATMEKGFHECGLGLKNLLRMNYVNVAYLNFGIDGFYRYGPYQRGDWDKNISVMVNANFSF